jgi:hypothetical protein
MQSSSKVIRDEDDTVQMYLPCSIAPSISPSPGAKVSPYGITPCSARLGLESHTSTAIQFWSIWIALIRFRAFLLLFWICSARYRLLQVITSNIEDGILKERFLISLPT